LAIASAGYNLAGLDVYAAVASLSGRSDVA
jgi:hypothetical protein